MLCVPTLVLPALARQVCLQAHFLLLPPSSSREREPLELCNFGWLIFLPAKDRGFVLRHGIRAHKSTLTAGVQRGKSLHLGHGKCGRIRDTDYSLLFCWVFFWF